ncbi:MAG: DUF2339 domain-containing protein [Gemmatimonadaceae bacterium]
MEPSESERLARLEREIAILRTEFARLRDHVGAPASAPRPEYKTAPPPPRPAQASPVEEPVRRPPPPRPVEDASPTRAPLEEVVGRYLMIAVATLMVLFGVGVFLNWAIRNGYLGPTARVVLGYLAALGIAFAGIRLRLRGTREFGNVLLALALAVVHLVCWSAGPLLHVLPSWVALSIGFVASAVLAEFALRHEEETLCAVGFGGAAIAPFVAGNFGGNNIAVAVYGVIVVALGAAALGARAWKVARGVTMWSVVLFTLGSGARLPLRLPPDWVASRLWILTPLMMLIAVLPFTHGLHRRSMIRVAAGSLIIGAFFRADQYQSDVWSMGFVLIGTLIAIGALDLTRGGSLERDAPESPLDGQLIDRAALLDAFLIPVGLFVATIASTPDVVSFQSAAVAVLFTVLAIWMTHRTRGEPEAGRYASTASLIALWIVPAAFFDHHLARVAGTAAMSIVLMLTALRMNRLPFVAGAFGGLVLAAFWAIIDADARARFAYSPFFTIESLGAGIATLGWVGAARIVSSVDFLPELDAKVRVSIREAFITGASVTAFFWGVAELQGAWNESASKSLLIVYYAATGALLIHLGRTRDVKHMRFMGLGLALWAAWKATLEAFSIPNAAARIAVFLAVGMFLLAVAYWYRRGGSEQVPNAATPLAER